jgi:hypothetical protein
VLGEEGWWWDGDAAVVILSLNIHPTQPREHIQIFLSDGTNVIPLQGKTFDASSDISREMRGGGQEAGDAVDGLQIA